MAKDQQVLNYLLSSLSTTSSPSLRLQRKWRRHGPPLKECLSQSRARIISTRMALATASKGASSISEGAGS
jgi:hypothetical protein